MVTEKGPFSFYYSRENRLECCRIRKLVPLRRALEGKECWISGIRASQSDNRSQMDWIEYDEDNKLFKFYPVFNWTFGDVEKFIKENNVPYNLLTRQRICQHRVRALYTGSGKGRRLPFRQMVVGRWQ